MTVLCTFSTKKIRPMLFQGIRPKGESFKKKKRKKKRQCKKCMSAVRV